MTTVNFVNIEGTARFINIEDITSRMRKRIFRAGEDTAPVDAPDLFIAHLMIEWSLEMPLPTPGMFVGPSGGWPETSLDDLTTTDYDVLAREADRLVKAMTPNFAPSPDPKSPTSPSGA